MQIFAIFEAYVSSNLNFDDGLHCSNDNSKFSCLMMSCVEYSTCKGFIYLTDSSMEGPFLMHQSSQEVEFRAQFMDIWERGK